MNGIRALSEEDRLAFEQGQASISDLSRKYGVTRQTAWKAIRRRGWKRVEMAVDPRTGPAPAVLAASGALAESNDGSLQRSAMMGGDAVGKLEQHQKLIEDMNERAWRALAAIYYVFLGRAQKLLQSLPDGNVNATALNTAVRLVAAAHAGLHNLGIWSSTEEEQIPELIIRCFTEEEEAQIRAGAAKRAATNVDEGVKAKISSEDDQNNQISSPAFHLRETPPERGQDLKTWLTALGHRNGRNYLRQIVGALGGKCTGDQPALIAEILLRTNGDPRTLVKLKHV